MCLLYEIKMTDLGYVRAKGMFGSEKLENCAGENCIMSSFQNLYSSPNIIKITKSRMSEQTELYMRIR
jgi:hypothetical protein